MLKKLTASSEPLAVVQFMHSFGDRVRKARIARGILQVDLAERAFVSVETLRRIEKGGLSARLVDAVRIMWALDDQALMSALAFAHDDELIRAHDQALPQRVRVPKKAYVDT